MREIGIAPSMIILEPVGRSTAPALAIPALWAKEDEDVVMVAMPSDHVVGDVEAFRASIRAAAAQRFPAS